MADDADETLVAALRRGDEQALAALYDRHATLLGAAAYRLLGNQRDAEDLVHDVFVEAWQKAATFDASRGSVRAWLMIRLRSRALDRRRALGTARDKAMLLAADESAGEAADDAVASTERAETRALLEQLTPDDREVVQLAYFEGLTSREIAERLGAPVGTIKSRLSRAVARLRELAGATTLSA